VELEDRGVRAVVLCTPDFEDSFAFHARIEGRDDYEPVIVEPVATVSDDEIVARADRAIPDIVAHLTGGALR
jgi:hypothetical protein